ncbi:DNA-binding CsgD family transcriptional regulator/tetratricopeptide (TPR) repeat protein [Kibdelosporangium banguiense]|uniref:DNA-binding CsgD family transcriptional regulator/tetratricopeptide (TPR) repeat protein n=1 Tax=Kibdelosporangium banguiense TaxID=1365924 RepID=A0ABS4TL62_9PSEU|nr:AAA family ATPase [Kibdelosporangium banguiense]MBP2325152.1 DNA-binding CsgD family transcriptional regulator/tetratricopeptide (TPR) repeat protein [Kibdelosporangium banguiense]
MDLPLVGRTRELAQLRGALVSASAGSGRLLLVSGDAGIGKTRLAMAVADMANDYDVPVARGYAVDDPGMPPLWPWRRLARDIPQLSDALSVKTGDSASARFAMFADATDALTEAAAERGLLIILEDLHWADRSSLKLLSHLAGDLARTRALILGTFRAADGSPLADRLPDLLRSSEMRSIRLTGLDTPDIAHWLRIKAPAAEQMAAEVAAKTNGNPLFVRMLIDHDLDGHPELRHLVLAQVPDNARDLLGAASVLGERIDPSLLTEVSGLDEATVADLLDQSVRAGVLRSAPAISFTHALVRDAVYEELAPSQRMALHQRAAQALERSDTSAAGRIANHWRLSGSTDWTVHCVHWARLAAAAAIKDLAYDEAVEFAELALRAPDAELTLELARAEFLAGRATESVRHCVQAARLADAENRPDLRAAAALVITGMGDPKTITAVDRLCAEALATTQPDPIRARLLAKRAMAAAETGSVTARDLSAQALKLAEDCGDPDALLDSVHARHFTLCAPQYWAERVELGRRACELAETAEQPLAALWGHLWLLDAWFQCGDLAAVDYELNQIERFATTHRHALAWWHLNRMRATRAALVGEFDRAMAFNEAAREIAQRLDTVATTGMYFAFLHQICMLRGTMEPDDGRTAIEVLGSVPEIALAQIFVPVTHVLMGDLASARATFEVFRRMPEHLAVGPRWAPLVFHIGVVAVMLDDVETADLVYRCFVDLEPDYLTDGSGAVFCAGASPRMLGELALTTGRVPEAVEHFRLAIEMNARIGALPFLALSRLGLAKALVKQGKHADLPEARKLAAEAAAEFRRLDLPGPLSTTDELMGRIRAASRSANPLSPRESEVAMMIGDAMSNRQIAERLVLSERTVESHVRSILAKLGYTTRTEIATWSVRETGG